MKEPGLLLQWGRGCYAAETASSAVKRIVSSPLQWGRGCYAAETAGARSRSWTRSHRFNGAAAVTPRRPDGATLMIDDHIKLQWGRGCYAAET